MGRRKVKKQTKNISGKQRYHTEELMLETLSELGKRLATVRTFKEAGWTIVYAIDRLFRWDACTIDFYSAEQKKAISVLYIDTVNGERKECPPVDLKVSLSPMFRHVLKKGAQLILRKDSSTDRESLLIPFGDTSRRSASLMFVPIRNEDRNVGVLSVQSYTPDVYDSDALKCLQRLADYCGGPLERIFTETERYRESEQRLQLLMEEISATLWFTDKELRVTFSQGIGFTPFGLTPEQIIGKTIPELFQGEETTSQPVLAHRQALKGKSMNFECRRDERHFDCHIRTLQDAEGEIIGCMGVAFDVTQKKQDEEMLKMFTMAIEQSAGSVMITDDNDIIEYVNPAFEKVTGYKKEEVIGKHPDILRSGKYNDSFYENIRKTILEGNTYKGIIIDKKKNGELFYHGVTITPLKDSKGIIRRVVLTGGDITARIQAEKALRQSEERLRLFMDSATDSFLLLDSELNIMEANAVTATMIGIPRKELIGKNLLVLFPSLRGTERVRKYREVIETGKPLFAEDIAPYPGFEDRHFEVKVFRVGDGLGIMSTDVTARKEAEKELKKVHQIYRSAIENAQGVPYYLSYINDTYEYVGEGCEELLGIPAHELTPRKMRKITKDIIVTDPKLPSDPIECGKAFRRGEIDRYRYDLRIITPRGKEKWLSDCSLPLRDEKTGKVIGALGILQEITERKKAEQELRESRDKLRRIQLQYQAVLRSTPNGLCLLSPDWRIMFANRSMSQILDPTSTVTLDIIGFPLQILFKSEEEFKNYIKSAVHSIRMTGIDKRELELQRRDGTKFWCEISLVRIDPSETATGYVATLSDITERKRAEESLAKEKGRLSATLRSIGDGVIATDEKGRIVLMNQI
ncbi:PAS domain S-box protein, partial [Candidatus Sumerlaeota bacterium]|nr:PAS domain S-box protein [Candidatus Sumerlaeota bacterium]